MENTAEFVLSQTGKPMSVIITLQGHYDISPKYINAKKTYCTGLDSDLGKMSNRMWPITSFRVYFTENNVQGNKNEVGVRRVNAMLKWCDKNGIKLLVANWNKQYVNREDFLKMINN